MATRKPNTPRDLSPYGAPAGVNLRDLESPPAPPLSMTPPSEPNVKALEAIELADKIRKMQDAAYNANTTNYETAPKRKKGGAIKGSDWHGFGKTQTGKHNHGF